jgi:hypothetical protein
MLSLISFTSFKMKRNCKIIVSVNIPSTETSKCKSRELIFMTIIKSNVLSRKGNLPIFIKLYEMSKYWLSYTHSYLY